MSDFEIKDIKNKKPYDDNNIVDVYVEEEANLPVADRRDDLMNVSVDRQEKKRGLRTFVREKVYPILHRKKKNEVSLRRYAACVFVLDLSESMNFPKEKPYIDRMNAALKQFRQSIMDIYEGSGIHLEVAVVSFHGNKAEVLNDFVPLHEWRPVTMTAEGLTPMGQGIEAAVDLVRNYRKHAEEENRRIEQIWMITFTDGRPTDSIRIAADLIHEEEQKQVQDFHFWIVAAESADLKMCHKITDHVIQMKNGEYEQAFHSVQNLLLLECK